MVGERCKSISLGAVRVKPWERGWGFYLTRTEIWSIFKMGWEYYRTVDPLENEPQVRRGLVDENKQGWLNCIGIYFPIFRKARPSFFRVLQTVWCPSINFSLQIWIFQIHQIFNISYFPQFNLSFKKKYLSQNAQNHPKIYTKPQNIGVCSKWRDLALLETWTRYWHKDHVERRQNSLQVESRLEVIPLK